MKKIVIILFLILVMVIPLGGCGGESENKVKEEMLAAYGENQPIDGTYDASLAANCSNGVFVGRREEDVISFKGVPYAEPPTGNHRWKDPVPAKDSDKIYEAYYYGASPIQTEWPSEHGSYYPKSEDCLKLNVWTNTKGPAEGKTVMVFFHGGSYGWGGTSDQMYDGHNLVEKYPDLVLVTVEYRLGIMGFIDFIAVRGGENFNTSGNLGLLDQVCALKWIRKNIASFGGNPDNVTIFGESAGGGSVSLLPLVKEADGLYRRAIAESGSIALTYSRSECQELTKLLLEKSGCSTMDELMALPEEKIIAINEEMNDYNNFPERDGVVLPVDPYAEYESGRASKIDLMTGTNSDEFRYWIREMGYEVGGLPGMPIYRRVIPILYENNRETLSHHDRKRVDGFIAATHQLSRVWQLTEFYNEMLFRLPAVKQAQLHADNGNKVYNYYWTMPGEDEMIGACHAIELSYIFNNPQVTTYNGNLYDRNLADIAQDMWVNFARTGDPSTGEITWEQYDSRTRKTMVLGEDVYMEEDLKGEQRTLLEPLLRYYFNGCYWQMDYLVPQTIRIIVQAVRAVAILVSGIVGLVILVKQRSKRKKKLKEES